MKAQGLKSGAKRGPVTYLHPEVHKLVMHRRAETGDSMQEVIHKILCIEFGREDLLMRDPQPVATAS